MMLIWFLFNWFSIALQRATCPQYLPRKLKHSQLSPPAVTGITYRFFALLITCPHPHPCLSRAPFVVSVLAERCVCIYFSNGFFSATLFPFAAVGWASCLFLASWRHSLLRAIFRARHLPPSLFVVFANRRKRSFTIFQSSFEGRPRPDWGMGCWQTDLLVKNVFHCLWLFLPAGYRKMLY